MANTPNLVDVRECEGSRSKTDARISCVVHCIESLQENEAVDEIQTFSGRRPEIADDEIKAIVLTANITIQLQMNHLDQYSTSHFRCVDLPHGARVERSGLTRRSPAKAMSMMDSGFGDKLTFPILKNRL